MAAIYAELFEKPRAFCAARISPGVTTAPGPVFAKKLASYCVPLLDGAGADGAGVIGCGDDEPEPVVLGGVTVREAVVVGGLLFAVLLLLFIQPAKIRKPISSSSETPATQLHMPPTFSSGRTTGSYKRVSSVKRGSVMASS
jgi:hypothetical protein